MVYSRLGRSEYPTRLLTKVWVYGYMRRMIHSQEVEAACWENTKFMYLLEGHKPPDHNTLARFRSRILRSEVGEDLERLVVDLLIKEQLLQDGSRCNVHAHEGGPYAQRTVKARL